MIKLTGAAETALSKIQDTHLDPMEEALFKAWAKANQIEKPDSPDNLTDLRGIYKSTGGIILPNGTLNRITTETNNATRLQNVLQERLADKLAADKDKLGKEKENKFKAERQDVTHKQKVELEGMKQKSLPHEAKMKEHDVTSKKLDIEKAKVGNEGKHIDMIGSLMKPEGGGSAAKAGTTSSE